MKRLSFIFGFISLFFLFSCTVPQSQSARGPNQTSQYPQTKIQVKFRFQGTTANHLAPGYMTTVLPGTGFDKPGDYYAKLLRYIWNDDSGSSYTVNVNESKGYPEGFTSNGGRQCYVNYHTAPILSFNYDGREKTQSIYFAVLGDLSNILGGLGTRFDFGRSRATFTIPSGLDPEKEIAVFTIKGHHVSVTDFQVNIIFERKEPKPARLTNQPQELVLIP